MSNDSTSPTNPDKQGGFAAELKECRKEEARLKDVNEELAQAKRELEARLCECWKGRKAIEEASMKLAEENMNLAQLIEKLLPFGEPPYSFAVFIGTSALDDGREKRIKEALKSVGALNPNFTKCYLLTDGSGMILGTVSRKLAAKLQPGQLVYITGNMGVISPVPENEIPHLKTVQEGVVEKMLGDTIVVANTNGFQGNGMVLSPQLKREIANKPLEVGDKVLVFAGCILKIIKRIASGEKEIEIRKTTFADIGGLDEEKEVIRDMLGLDFSDALKQSLKMEEAKGLVLHGPPGVGKTMLVRALANELGYYFMLVNGSDFESMWVGMSQKELRARLDKARKNKPAIIFFDEVEAAFPVRGAAIGLEHKTDNLAAFNTFMDGVEDVSGVFVIFGSNRIDKVDPAVIRSGRMNKKLYIPRPNRASAAAIFGIYLPRHPIAEVGRKEEVTERWIKKLLDEIYLVKNSTHLFTAFTGSSPGKKYYFKDFASGSLFHDIVNEIVLRAAKRLKKAGTESGPRCGVVDADLDGVVRYMISQDIPHDRNSRNQWLLTNGYRAADDFRDGDALGVSGKNKMSKLRKKRKRMRRKVC